MRAKVTVRLKSAVLDPAGEAVLGALGTLGYEGVRSVRVGKIVELDLEESDPAKAEAAVRKMADELLANPVIETFDVETLDDGAAG